MIQKQNKIFAFLRYQLGKSQTRKLKKQNQIPIIIYLNVQKNIILSICKQTITNILKQSLRRNALIYIILKTKKEKLPIMLHNTQKHKTKRTLEHIDFNIINLQKKIKREVPLILTGKSHIIIKGGKLTQIIKKIRITSEPNHILDKINLNITNIGFGSIKIQDIVIPKNITIENNFNDIILTVKQPKKTTEENGPKKSKQ